MESKNVGILGSGAVGQALAAGFKQLGSQVSIGSRSGGKVDNWDGQIGTFAEVAAGADLVVLAVKGTAAEEVVESVKDSLAGKTVIDATNPIADQPPEDGVIKFFTTLNDSLMERLQAIAPQANFVKVFNSVGNQSMFKPKYEDGKPTMFICGNSKTAKDQVTKILDQFDWEIEDMGGVKSARAIEPLCILWCIPAFLHGQSSHAFKLLKK